MIYTKWQTNDNFLLGVDPSVRPGLRAPTRGRPYISVFINWEFGIWGEISGIAQGTG